MYRKAFTLIELLVVIILMVTLVSLTAPVGSKIFNSFESYTQNIKDKHQLSKMKAFSFIQAKENNATFQKVNYNISNKGFISK